MFFAKLIVLFSLIFSATALVAQHGGLYKHRHQTIAARAPVAEPIAIAPAVRRKRSLGKRCTARPPPSSTTSTKKAQSTNAFPTLANAGGDPAKATTTKTTTKAATKTGSAPQNTAGLPSYMIGTQTGEGTYYATGLGACGITNNDSQHIVAVSHLLFNTFPEYKGGNPNNNPICGRKIIAHYGGNSVELTVTDRCEACKLTDLDMAPSAFSVLADQSKGRLFGVTWEWE